MKWLVLIVNTFCIATLAFNTTAIMNALPSMQHDLTLSPSIARWIINSYILCAAAFMVLGGRLGDLFGHFKAFFYGALLFALATLLIIFTSNGHLVLIARIIQGMAVAVISSGGLSTLTVAFPESQRAFAISFWGAMVGMGFGLGPILGGVLTTFFSWRLIFVMTFWIMTTAAAFNLLFLRTYPHSKRKIPMDYLGVITWASWLIPFVFILMEGKSIGWGSPLALGIYVWSALLLTLFLWREKVAEYPLINLHFFKYKELLGSSLTFYPSVFCLIAFLFFFNRFLQWPLLYDLSSFAAGLAILPMNICMFVTALFSSFLAKQLGFRFVLGLGMTFLIVGFAWFLLFPMNGSPVTLVYRLLFLGVGFGLTFPVAPHVGMRALPPSASGEGAGIVNTVNYLGGSSGIAFGTIFYLKSVPKNFFTAGDRLLMGSNHEIAQLLGSDEWIPTLQSAAIQGFSYVMAIMVFLAFAGLLASFFLIHPRQRAQKMSDF